ncbi:hypothetical protein RUM44_010513 [Polyplax serrata]|uniref:Uncharacterized protein n=1 Tax=Polyplax serrata TaxID=468196 RepID=A0ABR1AVS5_POLSC
MEVKLEENVDERCSDKGKDRNLLRFRYNNCDLNFPQAGLQHLEGFLFKFKFGCNVDLSLEAFLCRLLCFLENDKNFQGLNLSFVRLPRPPLKAREVFIEVVQLHRQGRNVKCRLCWMEPRKNTREGSNDRKLKQETQLTANDERNVYS